ncbi:MAG: hypothetical protein LiPW41_688 [Parcubacteria group bacterium LiPW_41]|nr:MAG: hypothetical protein LiPW41_688 [Parcubacteria group bacterium LiPW_41]
MAERKLYFYDSNGNETNSIVFEAVLTTPLSQFSHIDGCSSYKNLELLIPQNVGKKFKLSILDPFEVGEVTYLGDGLDAIPDESIRSVLSNIREGYIDDWFYVFQLNDELVISASFDVEPLF